MLLELRNTKQMISYLNLAEPTIAYELRFWMREMIFVQWQVIYYYELLEALESTTLNISVEDSVNSNILSYRTIF